MELTAFLLCLPAAVANVLCHNPRQPQFAKKAPPVATAAARNMMGIQKCFTVSPYSVSALHHPLLSTQNRVMQG